MTVVKNPYQQYKKNSVNTAGAGDLVLMMYDGALRYCSYAVSSIENKDIQGANDYIIKVQKILTELMSCLDMNYPISNNLLSLYTYMYNRLMHANVSKDSDIVKEVKSMLTELKTVWKEAVRINRQALYSQNQYD